MADANGNLASCDKNRNKVCISAEAMAADAFHESNCYQVRIALYRIQAAFVLPQAATISASAPIASLTIATCEQLRYATSTDREAHNK
jgi:hypothetical protein